MVDLFPAAQAALEAFNDRYENLGPLDGNWQEQCLAAALQALAGHSAAARNGNAPMDHWHDDECQMRSCCARWQDRCAGSHHVATLRIGQQLCRSLIYRPAITPPPAPE
jgi:hypothetical protein